MNVDCSHHVEADYKLMDVFIMLVTKVSLFHISSDYWQLVLVNKTAQLLRAIGASNKRYFHKILTCIFLGFGGM